MGEVHLARHKSGKLVAIKKVRKTLSLDPALCERLSLEAGMLSRIDHPNVVRVLDGGVSSTGQPFVVMSRAFGVPLDAVIAQTGPLPRERIAAIMAQLLAGLAAIHHAGVIHADLKSSNVLIDELDRVTIIDFGLARIAQAEPSDDEIFGGTPAYMAPELLGGGTPSIAADIYAAGVILYELLTGTPPLPRNLSALIMLSRRMYEAVELPSRRSPERAITTKLDDIVVHALARTPEGRFATVTDFADALDPALAAWQPSAEDSPTLLRRRRSPSAEHVAPTLKLSEAGPVESPGQPVITTALASASARVEARDVTGAIDVLEAALAQLAPIDPDASLTPDAWRIETVLAALYQSVGKKDHANRLARNAFLHAQRTNDPAAKMRTSALLTQLSSAQNRLARGSRPAPMRARRVSRP
jgi:serine/threonine protein kinase